MGDQHLGQRRFELDVKTDRAGIERLSRLAFSIILSFPLCDVSLFRQHNRSTFLKLDLTEDILFRLSSSKAWLDSSNT